jgi:predicted enzyme related to lactoylglutathione lyase
MTTQSIGRFGWLQVDCADPVVLARFWASALGVAVRGDLGDGATGPQYVFLEGTAPDAPRLSFQRVREPRSGKNRLHIDLAVDDVDIATDALAALGATVVPDGDVHEHEMHWRVLADPEGNQFCVVEVPPGS